MSRPTAMNPEEQEDIARKIGVLLLQAAPDDWQHITAEYRAVGDFRELLGEVTRQGGASERWQVPESVITIFQDLREAMYTPEAGTWVTATYVVERPSSYRIDVNFDNEPDWQQPPPYSAFVDELRRFPRPDENVPEWMRGKLDLSAGAQLNQPSNQSRSDLPADSALTDRPLFDQPAMDQPVVNQTGPFSQPPFAQPPLDHPLDPRNLPAGDPRRQAMPASGDHVPFGGEAGQTQPSHQPGDSLGERSRDDLRRPSEPRFDHDPGIDALDDRSRGDQSDRAPQNSNTHANPQDSGFGVDTPRQGFDLSATTLLPPVDDTRDPREQSRSNLARPDLSSGNVQRGRLPVPEPEEELRAVEVFDAFDPQGRPLITDRVPVPAVEMGRLRQYLESAPVLLSSPDKDEDVLDTARSQVVPTGWHTDGVWVWSQAVAYYLAQYGVPPEPGLVEWARAQDFTAPAEITEVQQEAGLQLILGDAPDPAEELRAVEEVDEFGTDRGYERSGATRAAEQAEQSRQFGENWGLESTLESTQESRFGSALERSLESTMEHNTALAAADELDLREQQEPVREQKAGISRNDLERDKLSRTESQQQQAEEIQAVSQRLRSALSSYGLPSDRIRLGSRTAEAPYLVTEAGEWIARDQFGQEAHFNTARQAAAYLLGSLLFEEPVDDEVPSDLEQAPVREPTGMAAEETPSQGTGFFAPAAPEADTSMEATRFHAPVVPEDLPSHQGETRVVGGPHHQPVQDQSPDEERTRFHSAAGIRADASSLDSHGVAEDSAARGLPKRTPQATQPEWENLGPLSPNYNGNSTGAGMGGANPAASPSARSEPPPRQPLKRPNQGPTSEAATKITAPPNLGQAARQDNTEASRSQAQAIQPLQGEPPLTLFRDRHTVVLKPGTDLDRFGDPAGNVTYAIRTPYNQRSLPPQWSQRPYRAYRVQRPLQVLRGTAVPWFEQPGGGTAYVLPTSIEELVSDGVLEDLPADSPPLE